MILFNVASALKIWDYGWIAGLVLYQIIFIVLPAKAIVDEGLPVASSTVILAEQVNLFHIYVSIYERSTTKQLRKHNFLNTNLFKLNTY